VFGNGVSTTLRSPPPALKTTVGFTGHGQQPVPVSFGDIPVPRAGRWYVSGNDGPP
jgi:hypothetical protein